MTSCVWPYDDDAAKTIECYRMKIVRFIVYVWKQDGNSYWNYTVKGHFTGECAGAVTLTEAEAYARENGHGLY
jgi:hypothetical protein